MHAFHAYISTHLKAKLEKRRVVVFYDPREEFASYIDELAATEGEPLPRAKVKNLDTYVARFDGSFFALREAVEPVVAEDLPDPLLVYVPGVERDRDGSVLMELEKGGTDYAPQLKRLARNVLRETHSEGQIDTFLASDAVAYEDIVGLLRQQEESDAPSMLRTLYEGKQGLDLLAAWLAIEADDEGIRQKDASAELYQLIGTRLGLSVAAGTSLAEARDHVLRYVLLGEFRTDLQAPEPSSLSLIPAPSTVTYRSRVRDLAERLRTRYAAYYQAAADQVESDFGLAGAGLDAEDLGTIDTFRFEADLMLHRAGSLVADGAYAEARDIIDTHRTSYWVEQDVLRQAQWEACRLMAELGREVERVQIAVQKTNGGPSKWIAAYAADDGWHRVDGAHRTLEAWVANMDGDPEAQQALGKVRRAYEVLLHTMAEGFTNALAGAGWAADGTFMQTQVYSEVVQGGAGRTAYLLVDALRYDMAAELAAQVEGAEELTLQPALAALPTVTPVGMAALLPGASSSFSVVEHKDSLAARIEGTAMTGLSQRQKLFKSKVPDLVDLRLEDVLQRSTSSLKKRVEEASLVLVRSQEIDALGEQGLDFLARQMMGTLIGNVVRAVRKLANAGMERFVIAADHGHQFGLAKGEDMRIDPPGGDTVKLTRRCWAGRGGQTPPGTVRVQGAELGYDTDLDFIFPAGAGVFRSGGDLSFHHGGASLQELVVPVLSFRMGQAEETKTGGRAVELTSVPEAVTNRTFLVGLQMEADLFATEPVPLRVLVLSGAEQVGEARMASDAEIDRSRGWVLIEPGKEATVGIILTREDCEAVRIVVQDPNTGGVYTESQEIPVKLGI